MTQAKHGSWRVEVCPVLDGVELGLFGDGATSACQPGVGFVSMFPGPCPVEKARVTREPVGTYRERLQETAERLLRAGEVQEAHESYLRHIQEEAEAILEGVKA